VIISLFIYLLLFLFLYLKLYLILICIVGSKKLSLSESFNDLHFVKQSKGGLAWDVTSPPRRHSNRSPDLANPCDKSYKEMVIKLLYFILFFCTLAC